MFDQSNVDDLLFKAFNLISSDKNDEANQIIEFILNDNKTVEKLNPSHWQNVGDICLSIGKFDLALVAYIKANNQAAHAFTLIILKKLDDARNLLNCINQSPLTLWCDFLIGIFSKKACIKWPTFLFIRHFLEFTIYQLLLSNNQNYIHLLLDKLNKLLEINLDSEKYIGYAYFHFGLLDAAINHLNNSIKRNEFDGEIYFYLGQIYLQKNQPHEALAMLENAKLFMPQHLPTKELFEKTKDFLSNNKGH